MVEQLICNQLVGGSSPFSGSIQRYVLCVLLVQLNVEGQVPERPNGADCKSAVYDFSGSNPLLPTFLLEYGFAFLSVITCGSSSVGRAIAFQAIGRGFEPRLPLTI